MNRAALTAVLNSLIHPTQLIIFLRNAFGLPYKQYSDRIHLQAAIEWLCRSQDKSGCGGSSASYGLDHGWAPPYPETTGYIISTFLRYSSLVKDDSFIERAVRMGDWEIDIQLPSGAVRGGVGINDFPIVFNTGMVILGWTDLFRQTRFDRYLSAAVKAADWLCLNMENDGRWVKNSYQGIPHAYHSRVSWSLLEVYKLTNNSKYKEAALRNITWVLSLVQENGWIKEMGFSGEAAPFTHTIAYTLRGLIECSHFFEAEMKLKVQNTVIKAAGKIMSVYEEIQSGTSSRLKLLPGNLDSNWQPAAKYSCLTGNVQMAIIWLKIFQLNNDHHYLDTAKKIITQLKHLQNTQSLNSGIHGGIAGSYPIWGSYMQFSYPNWAAKFFADALMLLESTMSEIEHQ
jgi:uncharacterized protein YyaL (SSP411 family)